MGKSRDKNKVPRQAFFILDNNVFIYTKIITYAAMGLTVAPSPPQFASEPLISTRPVRVHIRFG